jgi:hypothetical protein
MFEISVIAMKAAIFIRLTDALDYSGIGSLIGKVEVRKLVT